jgi:hypothetical protein
MNIAQALKEKNKKVANLQKLWTRISRFNSVSTGNPRPYNIEETWREINQEMSELIDLKARINQASAPVRKDIFAMSELKSLIQGVRGIDTTEGVYQSRYSNESTETTAVLNVAWQDAQIESIEKDIEAIQEKLDTFNHTTEI